MEKIYLTETMIKRLEKYRKSKIEFAKILSPKIPSYELDIEEYEKMTYEDLIEEAILNAYIDAEEKVKDFSKIFKGEKNV